MTNCLAPAPSAARPRSHTTFVSLLLACLATACALAAAPATALAAPETISGTCYVECTNAHIGGSAGGSEFAVSFPQYGIQTTGYCTSGPLYGTPLPGNYPFVGTRTDDGGYRIAINCAGADMYPNHYSPSGPQNVGAFTIYPFGSIALSKSSAAPDVSQNNPCYSLAGALFGIYADEACTQRVCGIETDAAGLGATGADLEAGHYWVREERAPSGFALDTTTYAITVQAGTSSTQTTGIAVSDVPLLAPAELAVSKVDARTGQAVPSGDAILAGAVFSVEHYAGRFASEAEIAAAGATPGLRWTVETDAEGRARLDGASLPSNGHGSGLPLGTVVVRELHPPVGYLSAEPATFICPVEASGTSPLSATYAAPTVSEQVISGDIALAKFGEADGTAGEEALKHPLAGIAFDIVHKATGQVAARIVTDDQGRASTATGTGTGTLPYGTYLVREDATTAPAGYAPAPAFSATVSEDGCELFYIVENTTGTALRVVKQDAETGCQVAGRMKFRILDADFHPVTFTSRYPGNTELTEFETGEDGSCTLPEKLNGGARYYVQETGAPEGYVLNETPVPFEVSADGAGAGFDNPLVVVMEDTPQKGRLTVRKVDATTGEAIAVAGTTWNVRATEDIITLDGTLRVPAGHTVATLVSDESGVAVTDELYLGCYEIQETEAPNGYLLADEPLAVELEPGNQELAVVEMSVDFADEPIEEDEAEAAPSEGLAATGSSLPGPAGLTAVAAIAGIAVALAVRNRVA